MKLNEWINKSENIFTHSDLQFLLRQFFCDKDIFLKQKSISLDAGRLAFFSKIKKEYKKGVPLAYLLGKEEFFGLEFNVNPDVLIPRQDTEVVTEKAIEVIRNHNLIPLRGRRPTGFDKKGFTGTPAFGSQARWAPAEMLDLCCGSANIAITIKKFFRDKIKIWASDISTDAITVAKSNVRRHKVKINLRKGNLFSAFCGKKFDIIVSNPPYIGKPEIKGSLKYEPRIALEAGNDGMYFIEKIIKNAHSYLKERGFLVIEAGYKHKKPINSILEKTGKYEIIEWIKDYGGNFRGVVLQHADDHG
ncbi:MAG: peptide chain release factor N(5)-glutamine methyltransferase [Candidatus Omnitrophica bacterium]|jgi:release factor glutamine methyltransferase|nr:peptide chain release factor N(5)-glutamine methyltransferase [Candidatus Omnitrophota bacterium]